MAVCGGAVINGFFLKEHVVDEISLVVAPHVDGNAIQKVAFDTLGNQVNDTFHVNSAKPLDDGGVHFIFKKDPN